MDINQFKETLGDEKFTALSSYVTDLIGQRDSARNESIAGRKKLKEDLALANSRAAKAMEKLGVDSDDELDTLPDAKGQAEALKQFQTKLTRAERERDEAKKAAEETGGKYKTTLQRAAMAEALSGHGFIAPDLVEAYVSQRLQWEGEDLLFKSDDGKLIPIKDGVAGIAKTRTDLLKPTGTGGAGVRQSNAGGGGGKTMTRSQFDQSDQNTRHAFVKEGGKVIND